MFQILAGVVNDWFINEYTGHLKEYNAYEGKNIEAIWGLIPHLPESSAQLLAKRLPTATGDFLGIGEVIKEDFYEKLPEEIQKSILLRKDFALPNWTLANTYRKKTFFNGTNAKLREAAASCNLDITYDEFDKILHLPIKETRHLCKMLWRDGSGVISLPVYTFIYCIIDYPLKDSRYLEEKLRVSYARYKECNEFLRNQNFSGNGGQWSYITGIKPIEDFLLLLLAQKILLGESSYSEKGFNRLDNATKCFREDFCGNENISRYLKYKPVLKGKLAFLKPGIVENDLWKTFCNFSELWQKSPSVTDLMQLEIPLHGFAMNLIGNVDQFEELLPNEESNDAHLDQAKMSKLFNQKEKKEKRVELSIALAFWIFGFCFLLFGKPFWVILTIFAALSMVRSGLEYDLARVTKAIENISKRIEKQANR